MSSFDILAILVSPNTFNSLVIYARTERRKQYGYEPYLLISQVITKESHGDFAEEELFPIREIRYADPQRCGGYGVTGICLKDGTVRSIDFEALEGRMML